MQAVEPTTVIELLPRRLGVHQPRRHRRPPLQAHEWWLADLEERVGDIEFDVTSVAQTRLAPSPLA